MINDHFYRVRLRFPGPGYVLHVSRIQRATDAASALHDARLAVQHDKAAPRWLRSLDSALASGSVRLLRKGE
jgi:hypothetical protein